MSLRSLFQLLSGEREKPWIGHQVTLYIKRQITGQTHTVNFHPQMHGFGLQTPHSGTWDLLAASVQPVSAQIMFKYLVLMRINTAETLATVWDHNSNCDYGIMTHVFTYIMLLTVLRTALMTVGWEVTEKPRKHWTNVTMWLSWSIEIVFLFKINSRLD